MLRGSPDCGCGQRLIMFVIGIDFKIVISVLFKQFIENKQQWPSGWINTTIKLSRHSLCLMSSRESLPSLSRMRFSFIITFISSISNSVEEIIAMFATASTRSRSFTHSLTRSLAHSPCVSLLAGVVIVVILRFMISFPELTESAARSIFHFSPSIDPTAESSICESDENGMNKVIPRRIHQMGPKHIGNEQWAMNQERWIAVYQTQLNYEYVYWTDDLIEKFILRKYPEALHLYLSYSRNVQRYDMARYLILHHFGGIYVDLDISPWTHTQWLNESLIHSEHKGPPTTIVVFGMAGILSNDLIAAAPGCSLMTFVISNLENYHKNWISPYLTVMASAGPVFFTEHVLQFTRNRVAGDECVRMVDYAQFGIKHWEGNSWHEWDAFLILALGKVDVNLMMNMLAVVVLFGIICLGKQYNLRIIRICKRKSRVD